MTDTIGYRNLAHAAMTGVLRQALLKLSTTQPGGHCVYIEFLVDSPGVDVPARLKSGDGKRMTIAVPRHYAVGAVGPGYFRADRVTTTSKLGGTIIVTFASVVGFFDPHAAFGMHVDDTDGISKLTNYAIQDHGAAVLVCVAGGDVVSLDDFRR